MPGDEQPNAVVEGWIDAQRRMWEAWVEATGKAASAASSASNGESEGGSGSSIADQWGELANRALQAWAAEMVPLANAAAESLAQGSERGVEILELSKRAWLTMVPGGKPFGDWEAVAAEYVDQLSNLLMRSPFEPLAQTNQVMELWRLSFDELAKLQRSWFEEFTEPPRGTDDRAAAPNVLRTFNDRYWDTWERTFGRLLESPNAGHSRELTEKGTKAMRAWVRFRRAATEYQMVLADAFAKSWSAFLAELVSEMEQGKPPRTAGAVLRVWGKTADRVLTELFATEPYGRAQGQLVNAAMAYRLAERDVVDLFLQMSHVPSRSELDEANRAIFELKRQVRDLQKTVKTLAQAVQTKPAPSAAAPPPAAATPAPAAEPPAPPAKAPPPPAAPSVAKARPKPRAPKAPPKGGTAT